MRPRRRFRLQAARTTNSDALNTPKSSVCSPTPMKRIGNLQPLRDGENHAALGGAVELGDDQAGHAQPLVEFLRLRDRILPDGSVEHQQHLVRCARVEAREHALDLLELLHEVSLRVQSAGRVGDQHIDVARARGLSASKITAAGSSPGLLRDDGHVIARRPDLAIVRAPPRERYRRPRASRSCPRRAAGAPVCRWWWSCRRR